MNDLPATAIRLRTPAKPLICRKCRKPLDHKGPHGYIHPECRKLEDHTKKQRNDRWRASKGIMSKRLLLELIVEKLDCPYPDVDGVVALAKKLLNE